MEKTQNVSQKKPLVVLQDYGIPLDMRARLCAYFETENLQAAKILANQLASELHAAQPSERPAVAQKLIAIHFESDHFCHAIGWLALQREYMPMQLLYEAFPTDKPFYAHAEWIVPFEDDKRWELPFGNQYFLAHYNELYHYPNDEPPGVLTETGLCAQILALMSYRAWESILPTTNQMIAHFNKLLWLNRDFDFLSQFSDQPHEDFEKLYAQMVQDQEKAIKKSAEKVQKAESLGSSAGATDIAKTTSGKPSGKGK